VGGRAARLGRRIGLGPAIHVDKLRAEAIDASWTEQILEERGLKAPIGEVKALPDAQAPQ
jgi:hypothetical protein